MLWTGIFPMLSSCHRHFWSLECVFYIERKNIKVFYDNVIYKEIQPGDSDLLTSSWGRLTEKIPNHLKSFSSMCLLSIWNSEKSEHPVCQPFYDIFGNLEPVTIENRDKCSLTFKLYDSSCYRKVLMVGFFGFFDYLLGCVVGWFVPFFVVFKKLSEFYFQKVKNW